MQIRSASYNPLVAISAALLSLGLQIAWFIDPVNGSDSGDGSALAPLKTMDEFNARLSGNYVQVAATLQLLGNVTDAPLQLVGTRFKFGASLTVSGTQTRIGSGSITLVTPIGNAGTTYPFQLTTTGIDWTTVPIGSQIVLQGGQVCFIRSVVSATQITVGAMTTFSSSAVFTPTAGLTFVVNTLSQAQPPLLDVSAQTNGAIATTSVTLQSLQFSGVFNCAINGAGVVFQGCEFVGCASIANNGDNTLLIRSCRFTMSANLSFRCGSGRFNTTACCFVTAAGQPQVVWSSGNDLFTNSLSFLTVSAFNSGAMQISNGGWHFDAVTAGPCLNISLGGSCFATGTGAILNGRNCAGSNFGIDVTLGQYVWNTAANKPTLGVASGCTADVRLGSGGSALSFTYAQLGTGKQYAQLDAVPPTTTQIQQGGYARMGQTA